MSIKRELELDYGHIYILEFDKVNNIYIIGKTKQLNVKDSIKQDNLNIKLLFSCDCPYITKIETNIINIFSIKFKKYNKGKNYFIGNINDMLIEMNLIINNFSEPLLNIKNKIFSNELKNLSDNDVITIDAEI